MHKALIPAAALVLAIGLCLAANTDTLFGQAPAAGDSDGHIVVAGGTP